MLSTPGHVDLECVASLETLAETTEPSDVNMVHFELTLWCTRAVSSIAGSKQ